MAHGGLSGAGCPGLLAISLGLGATIDDDHDLLAVGVRVYDALFAFLRLPSPERHSWTPG